MVSQPGRAGFFESVFEQLPSATLVYGRDLKILGVNRAAQRLLRLPAEQVVGSPCIEAFRCGKCDPACGLLAGLRSDSAQGLLRLRDATGQMHLAKLHTSRLPDAGGAAVAISSLVDASPIAETEPIAGSELMRGVIRFARRVAASEATSILLQGESGTGKDLIARLLHSHSTRQAEPFVAINCAAMPETLLESELFGYERGAFTDARTQKRGLFELAGTGTLFLDEIAELPLKLQAKLLRVLEGQTFRRLGGLADLHVQARIVAATNRNLFQAVERGEFRRDLYYRLNVIEIVVPPLRERREDIAPLADFYLDRYNKKFGRGITGIGAPAMDLLLRHDWPGNVRELKNALERAAILEESSLVQPASLPPEIDACTPAGPSGLDHGRACESLEEHELRMLTWALDKSGGNQTKAAALLGVSRDLLRYRLKKFQLLPSKPVEPIEHDDRDRVLLAC